MLGRKQSPVRSAVAGFNEVFPANAGVIQFHCGTAGVNQLFPMYVGVIRQAFIMTEPVPHECGGDPGNAQVTSEDHPCSPRVWG